MKKKTSGNEFWRILETSQSASLPNFENRGSILSQSCHYLEARGAFLLRQNFRAYSTILFIRVRAQNYYHTIIFVG